MTPVVNLAAYRQSRRWRPRPQRDRRRPGERTRVVTLPLARVTDRAASCWWMDSDDVETTRPPKGAA